MYRKLAALTGGLVLSFALAIPAAANAAAVRPSGPARPADTNHGCGVLFDQGNGETGAALAQSLSFLDGTSTKFCNFSIPINGEFEMVYTVDNNSCLAVNSSRGIIDEDDPTACSANGGDGDTWDRWTATAEGSSGGATIWEFKNQFNGKCLYDDQQDPAIYTTCSSTNHFEWFTWPGSNL
jgi:hypothetical protein